jgi:glycosyltransferase involved in cell wall biosynthesis
MIRAAFFSVVPAPYQRDVFRALSQRPEVELSAFYLEAAAPDSPWPEKPLAPNERILPGFWVPVGNARCHWNWDLPDLRQFDVVVLNTVMSFTAQWLMRAKLCHKPWLFWGERLSGRGPLHDRLTAPLHRASGIAAIGTFAADDYRARFPEPQHFHIPYFCELQPFLDRPAVPPTNGEVTFLLCGQMIARKGVDVLLEAFSRLGSRARLLLVGREAELPQLLGPLPEEVRARITYGGFQAPEELPRFFAQANVFVLPSRYDGWGVVVNQALGAGLPVVCSDMVGAGYDVVDDERNGLKFPAGDAAALAAKLQRFLNEPELCARWGAASREKAQEYLPERGAERWVQALTAVTRG